MTHINKIDKVIEQSLLYDFYGSLLTEHQQSMYEDYMLNDLSLSEIAEQQGITRQAVHEIIKRCNKILYNYEEKLNLARKFQNTKDKISQISNIAKEFRINKNITLIDEIEKISNDILEEF